MKRLTPGIPFSVLPAHSNVNFR